MKATKSIITLILLVIIIAGCNKSDSEATINLSVDRYIELLKANQYDSLNLPAFTYQDIPTLLKYRNDTQIITNFPHNGISSLYAPNCKLGIYVLWTIESIRAMAINSEYLIMRFPSQNPILAKRNSITLELVDDAQSPEVAANAYNNWWNSDSNFDNIKHIDPLGETEYKWH